MNFNEAALKLHEEHHGKIEVVSKVPSETTATRLPFAVYL